MVLSSISALFPIFFIILRMHSIGHGVSGCGNDSLSSKPVIGRDKVDDSQPLGGVVVSKCGSTRCKTCSRRKKTLRFCSVPFRFTGNERAEKMASRFARSVPSVLPVLPSNPSACARSNESCLSGDPAYI